jgi:hypothetical protein
MRVFGTQSVAKVGVAGAGALEAVYDSLADAARLVLAGGSAAAVTVVHHKYGPEAAQVGTGSGRQHAFACRRADTGYYRCYT